MERFSDSDGVTQDTLKEYQGVRQRFYDAKNQTEVLGKDLFRLSQRLGALRAGREYPVEDCRVCETPLQSVGSLGNIALSNFTEKPSRGLKMPLELKFCEDCSLPQLGHDYSRSLLYGDYWYRSALNPVIVKDLREIAGYAQGDIHIDIGSNDGSLLEHSQAKRKIAVDPSNIESGFERVTKYWEDVDLNLTADTITAVACLYDLPNPNKFMGNIRKHLKDDGTFIAQLMTLQPMIEKNDLGNVCHEHLEYYSYKSLVKLYEQNGLEIYDVQQNAINGGSYRLFARHLAEGSVGFKEPEYSLEDLRAFFERVETNKQRFLEWLGDKAVTGYGASTKMGTITQYYDYSPAQVVDVNPAKLGRFTNMGAEVIGEIPEDTEYLWIFPYGFTDYFKKKEAGYKGQWVTTIPEFEVS